MPTEYPCCVCLLKTCTAPLCPPAISKKEALLYQERLNQLIELTDCGDDPCEEAEYFDEIEGQGDDIITDIEGLVESMCDGCQELPEQEYTFIKAKVTDYRR